MTIEADRDVLNCVAHRLAEWRAGEDGRVVVERPRPESRGFRGLIDRFEWFLTYPRIRLDAIGSTVWKAMDGTASLAQIAETAGETFPDRADEMADRVAVFATALQKQGLIKLRTTTRG